MKDRFGSTTVEAVFVGSVRLPHFPVEQETFQNRPIAAAPQTARIKGDFDLYGEKNR